MSLFNFSELELFTFFAVLVRYGTLMAVLPFVGDRTVMAPIKVLLALVISISLFPGLLKQGYVHTSDAAAWSRSIWGIASTVGCEAIFGLVLGYVAKLAFDAISFGGNLAGTFMGFATASTYDPHQESQSQVVAEIQSAIAMLIFLAVDGHHMMLNAALESYRVVGLGKLSFGVLFSQKLMDITAQVFQFGIQLAAPIGISLFAVNIAFGVISKAMPQLNILVLSLSVSAFVGLIAIFLSMPQFQSVTVAVLERMQDWMNSVMVTLHG